MDWKKIWKFSFIPYFFIYAPLWFYIVTGKLYVYFIMLAILVGGSLFVVRNHYWLKGVIPVKFILTELIFAMLCIFVVFSSYVPDSMKATIFVVSLSIFMPTYFKFLDNSMKKNG
ncbi:hypothetical protein [Paenibacillus elgii]|uniref:hypothetical protein n=1 Tax=Paenibacillus elgii TaxID=189691 RepID=UPI000248D9B8|nr:hypothetical protein [Paenibacillus elgii]